MIAVQPPLFMLPLQAARRLRNAASGLLTTWPYGVCQELLTRAWAWRRQHEAQASATVMPYRPPPPAPQQFSLMVVSGDPSSRARLLAACQQALPQAWTVEVTSFSDAVLQLARGPVGVVLLDLPHLDHLSPAAALMLRGIAPHARLLAMGDEAEIPGLESVPNLRALSAWLQRAER